jgi:hypothetical protein
MMQSTTRLALANCITAMLAVMSHGDDPNDASGLVLGTTIIVRQDGSIIRIPERDALLAPWSGTAAGVSIGTEHGCALAWPLAMAPRIVSQAVWLSDGQCLPGSVDLGEVAEPGTIRWRAGPELLTLPLSALRAWTAVGVDVPTGNLDADRITLRNGDQVDGLVTNFGSGVTIDVDGATRMIDDELIASVQFVQAADPPTIAKRLRVWVDDGAIIDAESIERDGTLLRMKVPLPSSEKMIQRRLRIDQVLGMATPALSRNGLMLRTQGSVPNMATRSTSAPGGTTPSATTSDPGMTDSAPEVSPDPTSSTWFKLPGIMPSLELAGPGRLGSMQALLRGPGSWSIPITADGVLVSQVLVPDRVRPLADHALVVRQAGVELARIGARSDIRAMRVAVKSGTVELELAPGKAGPVGCMVELADLVFIRAAP